jgi:N-acetylglutamate synthase-like GNAT family acetyltransferase
MLETELRMIEHSGPEDITVTVIGRNRSIGVASASPMEPDKWWINRVLVQDDFHRKGLGKRLVTRLAEIAREAGIKELVVCPGGYNTPYAAQCNFYSACGFISIEEGTYFLPLCPKEGLDGVPHRQSNIRPFLLDVREHDFTR